MGVCNPKINVTNCLLFKGIVQMYIWEMKKLVIIKRDAKEMTASLQPHVLKPLFWHSLASNT